MYKYTVFIYSIPHSRTSNLLFLYNFSLGITTEQTYMYMHSIELTLFCSDVIILKDKILEILKGVYIHISIPNSNSIKIKTVGMTISSLDSWLVTLCLRKRFPIRPLIP